MYACKSSKPQGLEIAIRLESLETGRTPSRRGHPAEGGGAARGVAIPTVLRDRKMALDCGGVWGWKPCFMIYRFRAITG